MGVGFSGRLKDRRTPCRWIAICNHVRSAVACDFQTDPVFLLHEGEDDECQATCIIVGDGYTRLVIGRRHPGEGRGSVVRETFSSETFSSEVRDV